MNGSFRDNIFWIALIVGSAGLIVAWLPSQLSRRDPDYLLRDVSRRPTSENARFENTEMRGPSSADLLSRALSGELTPAQQDQLKELLRVERSQQEQLRDALTRERTERQRLAEVAAREKARRRKRPQKVLETPGEARAPSPVKTAPVRRWTYEERVRQQFAIDGAKFPLNDRTWSDGITVEMGGLSYWKAQNAYILSLKVINEEKGSFFIGDLTVEQLGSRVSTRAFHEMFVPAGETARLLIVFTTPVSGRPVTLRLREDSADARKFSLPVSYPF